MNSGLILYRLILWLLWPIVLVRLWYRGLSEPVYRLNRLERFGIYGVPPAAQPTLWVHAVSLGETRAAAALISLLLQRYPGHGLLLTGMTATGRAAAWELFGAESRVRMVWLPYDYPFAVRRFLDHFRPDLGILMETELWPNLLHECRHLAIPLLLANARLSARSAQRYGRLPGLTRHILGSLALVAAQSDADAARFRALGARRVEVTGNMKFDMAALAPAASEELRHCFAGRQVVLAASLREGEERLIMEAWRECPFAPDVLLVMVPRHPQRFADVAELLRGYEPQLVCRSERRQVSPGCRVFLGDSMGELPAYYANCQCAFVGGSLLEYGGQNLIEACGAGVPIMFGPHTFNFAEAAELALVEGAAIRVMSAGQFLATASSLLTDPIRRGKMGNAGLAFSRRYQGATAKTLALCDELLPVRNLSSDCPEAG